MGFESAFLELMPITISVSTRTSHDNYGQPVYSATVRQFRARYTKQQNFSRDTNGEPVRVSGTLWIACSTRDINESDRITLPDGTTPPIVSVTRQSDDDGVHHHKVSLGF